MNALQFKEECERIRKGRFSGNQEVLNNANGGLFELRVLIESLWQCCMELNTEVNRNRITINTLNKQIERLTKRFGEHAVTSDEQELYSAVRTIVSHCEKRGDCTGCALTVVCDELWDNFTAPENWPDPEEVRTND